MATTIVVAGATGNLGGRIASALRERGATARALVRVGAGGDKRDDLARRGAEIADVDMADVSALARACAGASCVVSALQGLRDVIVDAQSTLLDAALAAGVPRFIPSDYSVDFTKVPAGENRNFDLRRAFHERLDVAPVASTAIFNGAFAELLTYNVPLLDVDKKVVGYWGDPDWRIDFTTMDDTAAYTAAAALDPTTPRTLRIASFQVSAVDLAAFTADVLKTPFALVRMGSLDDLTAYNQRERAAHPEGEAELYPRWQQSQYILSMLSTHHASLDNGRYPDLTWATLRDLITPRL